MAKKRGNNEGSIYKRGNGSWRAQVTLDGRRLSFTANTRRECQEWLKKTIGEIDKGLTFISTLITLGEFLADWLSSSKSSISHNTWIHYNQLTRDYITPRIGQVKIKDLKPSHIQHLYDNLLKEDVGTYTVKKIHTILHSALEQAIKVGFLSRNPAKATIPPKEPSAEMKILDESQVSQMLVAANCNRLKALYHLAMTGMRQSELLGLKWTDLDWVNQTLRIERQLVRPKGTKIQFAPPKTKFGKRTIALGDNSIEVLRNHSELQNKERITIGDQWVDNGLIFTTSVGTPIHARNLIRDFKKLLNNAGLPDIRFHDLRHTAASIMLNHGVPVIIVSRRLGHARPSITLDVYGHLIPSMDEHAAQMIDKVVTPIELHPVAPGCTENVLKTKQ